MTLALIIAVLVIAAVAVITVAALYLGKLLTWVSHEIAWRATRKQWAKNREEQKVQLQNRSRR